MIHRIVSNTGHPAVKIFSAVICKRFCGKLRCLITDFQFNSFHKKPSGTCRIISEISGKYVFQWHIGAGMPREAVKINARKHRCDLRCII